MTRLDAPWPELAGRLAGALRLPGEPDYRHLTTPMNATAEQRPAAVVAAGDHADLAAAVRFAARHGLRITPQATGHGAGSDLGDGHLLVDTRRLTEVTIDPVARTALVGAGALWSDVADPAERHGLQGLAGTALDVGVCGYTCYGGFSWLARQYGLGSGRLREVEYVDHTGRLRRATEEEDPEVLWAYRGGGGVGLAARMLIELVPVHTVWAGALAWPSEMMPEIVERWMEVTAEVSEAVTSIAMLLELPPLPAIPEEFRGRSIVHLGICATDAEEGRAFARACQLGFPAPIVDSLRHRTGPRLGSIHLDPDAPNPGLADARMLRALRPETAVAALSATGIGAGGPLIMAELRHLGGAVGRPVREGALTSVDAQYLIHAVGHAGDHAEAAQLDQRLAAMLAACAPALTGQCSAASRAGRLDAFTALIPPHAERLARVLAEHDPGSLFQPARALVPDRPGAITRTASRWN
ncbi:MAG TPA: FAD-dependent oxidoreductase [Jatrophihabitans sp.]|nr:FAD-dependent oxidoreductase [Jatrophihabitans sp.]